MTDGQSTTIHGHPRAVGIRGGPSGLRELPRYERKKIQTRERIYRAALKLFAKRGLEATTVDEIVAMADVAKGTFFNYFHSKEQIFAFLIEIQLGKVAEAAEQARKGKDDIREVLRHAFLRLGEEVGRSPHLARAMVAAILGNEVARETVAAGIAEGRELLAAILRLGQRQGRVRKDRKAEAMSLAFQQALFGAVVLWAIRPQAKVATRLDPSFQDYWSCIAARGR
jgi:AcrR family transcriptional regulator